MVLDLWERLHPIFIAADDQQPEIVLESLSVPTARAIIDYLLQNSREVQTAFYMFKSEKRVHVGSLQEAVGKFASGELVGGFLVEPRFCGLALPVLGVFSDRVGCLSIDYEMGAHWTPVILIALFESFRMIRATEQGVIIRLSERYFDQQRQTEFARTLQEYLNETY